MRYSLSFKETQVKKILPPESKSLHSVSKETGIAEQTLRNWLNKAKEGTLGNRNSVSGSGRSPREKLNLLIESRSISEENKGRWLRENGLHSEHLTQYEQELRDMVEDNKHEEKMTIKKLKQDNRRLQKELDKKEKALAEMAALYTLKKKSRIALGGKRGRLIPSESRKEAVELINEAIKDGARIIKACQALDFSVSTFRRWKSGETQDKRKGAKKRIPRKLTEEEETKIIETCCNTEY